MGFRECPQLGTYDCWETTGSRTAVQLIDVLFLVWSLHLHEAPAAAFYWSPHWLIYICVSLQNEWNMIVITIFLLFLTKCILFSYKTKRNLSLRSYSIQFERKLNSRFLDEGLLLCFQREGHSQDYLWSFNIIMWECTPRVLLFIEAKASYFVYRKSVILRTTIIIDERPMVNMDHIYTIYSNENSCITLLL